MIDLAHLRKWVGSTEQAADVLTAWKTGAFAAMLDRDDPAPQSGDPLPPLWHWMLCVPYVRQSAVGPDGHAARGGFLPPVPLPRRMWAGGRLEFLKPLRVGEPVTRRSEVASVQHKAGRSGDLVFVLVKHEYSGANGPAIREEHDIVYRPLPAPDAPAPAPTPAPEGATWEREIVPDDVLLFRYSALTFNGHRIHYDRRYVTEVEGYPGLIVHGPMIATMLVDLLRDSLPASRLARFEFRAMRPVFDIAPFRLCGKPSEEPGKAELWVRDADGFLAMQATATLA